MPRRTLLLLAFLLLAACASNPPIGGGGHGVPFPETPPASAGEAASWGVLVKMSLMAFVPALAAAVASGFLPQLRATAGTLMAIAIATAAAPWALSKFGPAMLWPAAVVVSGGLAVCIFALLFRWLGRREVKKDLEGRLVKINADARSETDLEKRLRDEGASMALTRTLYPKVDKVFHKEPKE